MSLLQALVQGGHQLFLQEIIQFLVQTSIFLIVFSIGLQVSKAEVLSALRKRGHLLRALLAMNVVMPLVALALALAFDLHPAIKIALVALALSPVPPLLPKKELKAGGNAATVFGLFVAPALVSIALVPLGLESLGRAFRVPLQLPASRVALIVGVTVLVPLALGMMLRKFAFGFAERIAQPLGIAATIVLVVAALPIAVSAWPAMVSLVGDGSVIAFATFIAVGLVVGHLLGGPDPGDRRVLAFCTASRHPAVALAIAGANFPDQKLTMPAVLMYVLVGLVLAIPYARLRRQGASDIVPSTTFEECAHASPNECGQSQVGVPDPITRKEQQR